MEGTECQRMWLRIKIQNLWEWIQCSMSLRWPLVTTRGNSIHQTYNWTLPWNLELNTHGKTTNISYLHMYRCFHQMYATKTAWDRAQRRSEGELNFIRQSRVFKQWKKTKRSIQPHGYTTFHTFQKGRQKNGARTERTWYLIWKAADRCLLKSSTRALWMLL